MKILWLSHVVPFPPSAGVLQRSYNMVKELAKYHDVYLLSFVQRDFFNQIYSNPDHGINNAKKELKKICKYVEFVELEGVKKYAYKEKLALKSIFTKYPYTINWMLNNNYSKIIKNVISENTINLVHFDTISLAPYIKDVHGIKKVMNHHNIESHLLIRRSRQENSLIKKLYYLQEGIRLKAYEKEACIKFDLNMTCSKVDADRLNGLIPNLPIEVIPNGVDISNINQKRQYEYKKEINFIGTLNWDPNKKAVLFIANEIWPILSKKYPGVICNIIGTNPPMQIVKLSKIDKNFRVHGFVSDITQYQTPGTIFVCPIKDGGGTKLKILDAFANKAAVVADEIACEGIEVTNYENVIFSSQAKDYVDNITYLLNNHSMRKNLGKSANNLIINKYSYEKIGKSLACLYENLIQ